MAKVTGPVFSLQAQGSIRKTIVFQGRPTGTSAFAHVGHYNTKTIPQLNQRAYFEEAIDAWKSLTPSEKTEWENILK